MQKNDYSSGLQLQIGNFSSLFPIKASCWGFGKRRTHFWSRNILKEILGNSYKLDNTYKALQTCLSNDPRTEKVCWNYLVGQGMIDGSRTKQHGGFLRMLSLTSLTWSAKCSAKGCTSNQPLNRSIHYALCLTKRKKNAHLPATLFWQLGWF